MNMSSFVITLVLAADIAAAVTGEGPSADVAPVTSPRVRWNQPLPAVNDHECLPVAPGPGGTRLYTVSGERLFALETESGKMLNTTAGAFRGGPVLHGTTLLVTGDTWLKALDVSGDAPLLSWTANTVGRIQSDSKYCEVLGRSRAIVVGDRVIFGGPGTIGLEATGRFTDTKLYAVDAKTGAELWRLETDRMVCGRMIAADADLGLCFVALTGQRSERMVPIINGPDKGKERPHVEGGPDGVMIAVEVKTGKEKWRTAIGSHMSMSGPAVSDGILYCAGNTEAMAMRMTDGAVLWRAKRTKGPRAWKNGVLLILPPPPVVITGEVFITGMDDTVDAFDRKDGKLRWSVERTGDVGGLAMAAARQVVYTVGSHSGMVQAIDATTGAVLWQHILPDNQATQCVSLLPLDGRLVIGSRAPTPRIYCLENGPLPSTDGTRP